MGDLKEIILERLRYDPSTGIVCSRIHHGRHFVGRPVGTDVHGRLRVILNGKSYSLANVIWVLAHGRWPKQGYEIDHKDRNAMNNRLENLREVTVYENRAAFDYNINGGPMA